MKKLFLLLFLITSTVYSQSEIIQKGNLFYLSNKLVVKLKREYNHLKNQLPETINKSQKRIEVKESSRIFQENVSSLQKGEQNLENLYVLEILGDPISAAKKISAMREIEWAEPKYVHRIVSNEPNDPIYIQNRQKNLERIFAKQAWEITKGDSSVIIAIIDTGVDWNHPDLKANIAKDGSDQMIGYDFGGKDGTPDDDPSEDKAPQNFPNAYHGTHVAGIASAVTNNGIGIASIGYNCRILPVKASRGDRRDGNGDPYIYYGFEGIKYAADNGAKVVNCSWGGYGYSRFEQEIIDYAISKGTLVVAAAGNKNTNELFYPASYKGVLSVGWLNTINDLKNSAGNYGTEVDVMSPGTSIFSTWPSYTDSLYKTSNGSSMSSPLTAGLAGLVFSKYKNYTPLQAAERIRVSGDDVYYANPENLKNLLGKGRINALNALKDTNLISVRATDFNFIEQGNGNGLFESGESITVQSTIKNFLGKINGLMVNIKTDDIFISVKEITNNISTLDTLQALVNAFSFKIDISENAPYNHVINILLEYSTTNYNDYQWLTFKINPTYDTHNINNVAMTVTSKGAIGFNDFPNNIEGVGFKYKGGENMLYEGAFMYGVSKERLMDAARKETAQSTDFVTTRPIMMSAPGTIADQEGHTDFNDSGAGTAGLGITTHMYSYQFKNPPNDNYIILKTELHNTSAQDIFGLYAGYYFDWDLPGEDFTDDITKYDITNNFAYVYDENGSPEDIYIGAALISHNSYGYYALNQTDTEGVVLPNNNGFTDEEKWISISSGIRNTLAGPSDIAFVVSGGPFDIPAGGKFDIAFSLAAGETMNELTNAIQQSRNKYSIITDVKEKPETLPIEFVLYQNYPNPFNPTTIISYQISEISKVQLKVFDLLGREVAMLVNEFQQPGIYNVKFNAGSFPSGVYFYRISAGNFSDVKKLLLVR